jgi:UDP-glucose 4-epimerase
MPFISDGNYVVLGGASQIGATIAERLLAAGAREVVLLDNLSLGSTEVMQPMLSDPRCRFVRGDVTRLHELHDPLAKADGVFYVAGVMASTIADNPWAAIDVNARGFQNALEACRYQGVRKIVLSSSAGVYGMPKDDPTDEDTPLRWQAAPAQMTLYFASKVMSEGLARFYSDKYGIEYVALRYSAVYGERQHRRAMMGGGIAEACERVRSGLVPIVDGDGEQVQDFVYVGDVARANLMAMESTVSGESINIVGGEDISQNRIMQVIRQATGATFKPEYRPYKGGAKLAPVARYAYSREKARRLLQWEPQVSIEEGVRRVLGWVDAQPSQASKAA